MSDLDLRYAELVGHLLAMSDALLGRLERCKAHDPKQTAWERRRLDAIDRVIHDRTVIDWTTEQMDAALAEASKDPEPIASGRVSTR